MLSEANGESKYRESISQIKEEKLSERLKELLEEIKKAEVLELKKFVKHKRDKQEFKNCSE